MFKIGKQSAKAVIFAKFEKSRPEVLTHLALIYEKTKKFSITLTGVAILLYIESIFKMKKIFFVFTSIN